ncbi:MAG: hypothetical protein MJE12_11765 [Alphaproteobacteria bacterium]|nr:hypothetical protein [Alphaproteobacteria bacterium]
MKVTVLKTAADPELKISRDDGVMLSLRSVGRKFSPPHDIAHFVIECELGLQRGFWGSVADGAKFKNMRVLSGRQRPHAGAQSKDLIKKNEPYLNEAEVFVGVYQRALFHKTTAYRRFAGCRRKAGGQKIDSNDVEHIWSALVDMRKQWEKLPVGDSITLEWPMRAGRRTERR